jgi:F-type H+-transporting ATPase subunit delta|tara:strand:- start:985 stop:1518 length:534 start_codon:yes stop_codon:yes gene_type:complete
MTAPQRYAQALFEIGLEQNCLEKWSDEMDNICSVFDSNDVIALLDSPQVPETVKMKGIDTLLPEVNSSLDNLIFLMMRNGDISKFRSVKGFFEILVDEHLGITRAEITTVSKITAQHLKDLKKTILQVSGGSTAKISETIDEEIVGGIIIKIGDKLIDASSKNKLGAMREFLFKGSL